MSQYRQGYAWLEDGSNIITSSGSNWSDIVSGVSVLTIENNYGFYFINSVTGPHYDEPYIPGNSSGCYKIYLSSPYEIGSSKQSGYCHYAITNDFTPYLGLPIVQKGDINTATLFSAALYKLDQTYYEIKSSGSADLSYLVEDFENSINEKIEQFSGSLIEISGKNSSLSGYTSSLINSSGLLLSNLISSGDGLLQNELDKQFLLIYSESGRVDSNYSNILSLNNRVSALENTAFGNSVISGLSGYVYELSQQNKEEIESDLAITVGYITGALKQDILDNSSGISELEYSYSSLANIVAINSYKINYNSGIFNQRLISSGQNLINLINQISDITIPSITSSGHAQNTDIGTSSSTFYIGSSEASRILFGATDGSGVSIKNYNGSAYRDISARNITLNGKTINFIDGNHLLQDSGHLYFNGIPLADQNWVTGNIVNTDIINSRLNSLEGQVAEIFSITGMWGNTSYEINSLQSQITDNDKDILEIRQKIAGSGIHGFKQHLSPYGSTDYTVDFGMTFSQTPYVVASLQAGAGDPVIAFTIKEIDTTSMSVTFASAIPNSNYYLQVMAYDVNG